MARQVTGTQGILKAARVICRLVNRFGVVRLAGQTSPEFAAACAALAVACAALDAADDFVAVIDRTPQDGGTGSYNEDITLTGTAGETNERAEASG